MNISPKDLFDKYHRITEYEGDTYRHLGLLHIRQKYTRRVDLSNLVENILAMPDGQRLSEHAVSSIVLFGETVTHPLATFIPGEKRTVSLPFLKKSLFSYHDANRTLYHTPEQFDLCIITADSRREEEIRRLNLFDMDFFSKEYFSMDFRFMWLGKQEYLQSLRNNSAFAREIYAKGVPLVDDGFFHKIASNTDALYEVDWKIECEVDKGFFPMADTLIHDDLLQAYLKEKHPTY